MMGSPEDHPLLQVRPCELFSCGGRCGSLTSPGSYILDPYLSKKATDYQLGDHQRNRIMCARNCHGLTCTILLKKLNFPLAIFALEQGGKGRARLRAVPYNKFNKFYVRPV